MFGFFSAGSCGRRFVVFVLPSSQFCVAEKKVVLVLLLLKPSVPDVRHVSYPTWRAQGERVSKENKELLHNLTERQFLRGTATAVALNWVATHGGSDGAQTPDCRFVVFASFVKCNLRESPGLSWKVDLQREVDIFFEYEAKLRSTACTTKCTPRCA